MSGNVELIETLKDVKIFRDSDGNVTGQKGTVCSRFSDGRRQWVEKKWVSGDWVFSQETTNTEWRSAFMKWQMFMGLPVPRLLESNDKERTLHIEYIPGASISWPCEDSGLLPPVLSFFDVFKEIDFAPAVSPFQDGWRENSQIQAGSASVYLSLKRRSGRGWIPYTSPSFGISSIRRFHLTGF